MNYLDLLKSPMWQKKRLQIMSRDNFSCKGCGATDEKLNVHHIRYAENCKPWEYDNKLLTTLCDKCHSVVHLVEKSFKFDFIELTADCINMSGYYDNPEYLFDMAVSFDHHFGSFDEVSRVMKKNDCLVFDSINQHRTYVFVNGGIDNVNKIVKVAWY